MSGFRPRPTALAVVLLLPGLAGCGSDLAVTVTSERSQVVFTVPTTSPPCVNELRVSAADAPSDPIWYIDSSDSSRCVTRFPYGTLPAGFTQIVPAAALTPGKLYRVAIERPGATGISYFSPGRDGTIGRDAP